MRQTDRRTDGRMVDEFIDPARHTMRAVSIIQKLALTAGERTTKHRLISKQESASHAPASWVDRPPTARTQTYYQ